MSGEHGNVLLIGDFSLTVEEQNLEQNVLWINLIWNVWLKNLLAFVQPVGVALA